MNGKENIINKILSDADEKCARILASAEQTASNIKAEAEKEMDSAKQQLTRRAQEATAERIRNRVATAELDARKEYGMFYKHKIEKNIKRNSRY